MFVTGAPSSGKTTLVETVIRRLLGRLRLGEETHLDRKVGHLDGKVGLAKKVFSICGFTTTERRSDAHLGGGKRLGFDVVPIVDSFDRNQPVKKARLATAYTAGKSVPKSMGPSVGNYVVHVADFEETALPAVTRCDDANTPVVVVIDEVGKMELKSEKFIATVHAALDRKGEQKRMVLGTLPTPRYGHKIQEVEDIRAREDVLVLKIKQANRDAATDAVTAALTAWTDEEGLDSASVHLDGLRPFLDEGQEHKLATTSSAPSPSTPQPEGGPAKKPRTDDAINASAVCGPLIGAEVPRVLLLGHTASPAPKIPGTEYAERSMWSVLGPALNARCTGEYTAARAAAAAAGIAIWDVYEDLKSRRGVKKLNDLSTFLRTHDSIDRVCFIGAQAKSSFVKSKDLRKEISANGDTWRDGSRTVRLITLPSSSRANTHVSQGEKVRLWRESLLDKL